MRGPWGDSPGKDPWVDASGVIHYNEPRPGLAIQNGSTVQVPGAGNPAYEDSKLQNGGLAPGLGISSGGSVVRLPGAEPAPEYNSNSAEAKFGDFNANSRAVKFGETAAPPARAFNMAEAGRVFSGGTFGGNRDQFTGFANFGKAPGDTPGERFNAANDIFSKGGPATSGQDTASDRFNVAQYNFNHGGPATSGQHSAGDLFNVQEWQRQNRQQWTGPY